MDALQVFSSLGDLVGGALQVIADFINVLIDVLPNPDPFPALIADMAIDNGFVGPGLGFSMYWLDSLIGIQFAVEVLGFWAGAMAMSGIFALVWSIVKSLP